MPRNLTHRTPSAFILQTPPLPSSPPIRGGERSLVIDVRPDLVADEEGVSAYFLHNANWKPVEHGPFSLKGAEDSVKRITLTHNQKKWRPIRNEVKEWVLGNWYEWVEEKPLWFTEAWVNNLPADMVPEDEDKEESLRISCYKKEEGRWGAEEQQRCRCIRRC